MPYYTSYCSDWCGIKYGRYLAPPEGIIAALAQPDPSFSYAGRNYTYMATSEFGAGYNGVSTWVTRLTLTFWIDPDPAKLPIKRAVFRTRVYSPYDSPPEISPAWRLWWATSPYLYPYKSPSNPTGGNFWGVPLLAPATDIFRAQHWDIGEELSVELQNVKTYCLPHVYQSPNWPSHCCLAAVIENEQEARPTTAYDYRITFNGVAPGYGSAVDLYYDTRVLTPLVSRSCFSRCGVKGPGHRTR